MKVMLTGTYSSWNKGDAAMELATIGALGEAAPDVEVVVSSPFAVADRPTYAPTRVVQCNRRRPIAFLQVAAAMLARLLGRPAWLLRGEELRELAAADVVVDLSGDMLTEDYGVLVAVSHYLPLLQSRLLGVPYIICAQSIGPFRWSRPLAHWLLRGAAAVTVREAITADRLRAVRPDVEQTADMAYLLAPDPGRVPPNLPGPTEDVPVVGVALSELVASRHEPGGSASFDEEVVAALEQLTARHPHHIRFVAHVTGPSDEKDDRRVARRIAARLGGRAHVVDADLHPAALKAIIGACDVFVGARMHANIAALTSGVPVVAISYSHKTEGIMREFGQADMVVPAATLTADDLVARLDELITHREARAHQLRSRCPDLVAAAHRNVDGILKLLDEASRDR